MLYPPVPQAYAAGVPTNRLLDVLASWPAEQVICFICVCIYIYIYVVFLVINTVSIMGIQHDKYMQINHSQVANHEWRILEHTWDDNFHMPLYISMVLWIPMFTIMPLKPQSRLYLIFSCVCRRSPIKTTSVPIFTP